MKPSQQVSPLILETNFIYHDPFARGRMSQERRENPGLGSSSRKVKVWGQQRAVQPICSACSLSVFSLPCKLCRLTQKCMHLSQTHRGSDFTCPFKSVIH